MSEILHEAAMRACEAIADERLFTWLVMREETRVALHALADAVTAAMPVSDTGS